MHERRSCPGEIDFTYFRVAEGRCALLMRKFEERPMTAQ